MRKTLLSVSRIRCLVCCVQFVREFAKLGLTRSVGGVLALALARELTPVVTAIILAGRVGSAFAAELGTMQVRASAGAATTKMRPLQCFAADPGARSSLETYRLVRAMCNQLLDWLAPVQCSAERQLMGCCVLAMVVCTGV